MKNFWAERSQREQILITIAASLFSIGVIYYLIIAPTLSWREQAARNSIRAEATYRLVVEAASSGVTEPPATDNKNTSTPIRNTLVQTARSNGITLNFVNVRAEGRVDASVDAVDPQTLFKWTSLLYERYAVEVINADIARENGNAGLVRAQFTFGRKQ